MAGEVPSVVFSLASALYSSMNLALDFLGHSAQR